jgi:hypothetical protein
MRFSVFPFKHCGQWVFSDASVGVHYEPFVRGADELIDDLVLELEAPERGFRLNFSSLPFKGGPRNWRGSSLRVAALGTWIARPGLRRGCAPCSPVIGRNRLSGFTPAPSNFPSKSPPWKTPIVHGQISRSTPFWMQSRANLRKEIAPESQRFQSKPRLRTTSQDPAKCHSQIMSPLP